MYGRGYRRGVALLLGPPPGSGCVVCLRRWTLLLRYSAHSWACWRPACRRTVRDFLATV